MVPTQDFGVLVAPALQPFPSFDYLPACVVAFALMAFAAAIVLVAVRRRDAD